MNIIDILTWSGAMFFGWAIFCAFVVAGMEFRDPKSWHGWMISLVGEFWDPYKFHKLNSTCSYWLALVFLPFVSLATVVICLILVVLTLIAYCFAICLRLLVRLFWFSMNGEFIYLTKDIKKMIIERPCDYERNFGSDSFRPSRSLAVYFLVAWGVYQLAVIDYSVIVSSAATTVNQVDWSGNLVWVGIAIGIVLAYKGIRRAWPTIAKAWNIFHGKICYKLPIKSDVLDG